MLQKLFTATYRKGTLPPLKYILMYLIENTKMELYELHIHNNENRI